MPNGEKKVTLNEQRKGGMFSLPGEKVGKKGKEKSGQGGRKGEKGGGKSREKTQEAPRLEKLNFRKKDSVWEKMLHLVKQGAEERISQDVANRRKWLCPTPPKKQKKKKKIPHTKR